jgi:hypothetical protein
MQGVLLLGCSRLRHPTASKSSHIDEVQSANMCQIHAASVYPRTEVYIQCRDSFLGDATCRFFDQ